MSSQEVHEKALASGVVVEPVNNDSSFNSSRDSSNPYGNTHINTAIAYEDQAVLENQSRLRRLFSFVQLLAFALTFMSSWEVVAM